jgi:hypothetical protein
MKSKWLKTLEKLLNIHGNERSANPNHSTITPHSFQNSHHQEHKQQMLVRMWGEKNPHTVLVGI